MLAGFLLSSCAHQQDRHTFQKGETLERIAHRYQVDKKKLAALNGVEELVKLLPAKLDVPVYVNLTPERGPIRSRFDFRIKKAVYRPTFGSKGRYVWPVAGRLSSNFGRRWGTNHQGIDISAPSGTPIKAARKGRVIHSGYVSGYGKLVILYHGGGYSTVYAHASKLLIKKGARVKRGQRIALVGSTGRSTGPHLHFEVRKFKEAVDPMTFLR